MTQPSRPRPGRKRPEILADIGGVPDNPEELADALMVGEHVGDMTHDQHQDEAEVNHEPLLVMEGDIITASATLAIDFGDGKTNYFGYKHTTRVADQEDHVDTYARVATVVNEGVIGLIDDNKARFDEYTAEVERRYAAAQAAASRQARQ